ncbi:MAG: LytTR family transcriptional regulator DNA-binding domain-containing protein, partial [Bacteroidota bacterium]
MSTSLLNIFDAGSYREGFRLLIGIFVVTFLSTFIGTDNDLTDPESLGQFCLKLVWNTGTVAFCWLLIRRIIVFFDEQMPWRTEGNEKRWMRQLLVTILVISLLYPVLLWSRTLVFDFWPLLWEEILLTDYPLSMVFIVLINFWYYYLWQPPDMAEPSQGHQLSTVAESLGEKGGINKSVPIRVSKGRSSVLLAPSEIAFAFRRNGNNYVFKDSGECYYWDKALQPLEELLPDSFRINRQILVRRSAVKTFTVLDNRNLSVELRPEHHEPVVV